MAVSCTNSTLSWNTITTITDNAATSTTIDEAEAFTITPTKTDSKVLIEIENTSGTNGTVTYSVAAGDFWAAGSALTGSVAQGLKRGIVLESAKYKKSDGTIVITFTPASGKILLTDHALKVRIVELP